jgi:hypothetical protein
VNHPLRFPFKSGWLALTGLLALSGFAGELRWFKGNLHTHSLWSDGDDYPEMIADWYKNHGYHFLAISDHNAMQTGRRWLFPEVMAMHTGIRRGRGGGEVLEKYVSRFGADWVEFREQDGRKEVRLKPLDEYRALFEEPGRFLMIPSEEISATWGRPKTATEHARSGPIHINVTNPREFLPPLSGATAVEVMQKNIDAVLEQQERTGQAMFPHLNHPNFRWAVTAEELMQVKGERFFEVYNGHHEVNNAGDHDHLDTDAIWDAVLTRRLTDLGLGVMFAVATDDTHHYHGFGPGKSNGGRGWVMVRARHLTTESIVRAMEAGDFYASTGVTLHDVRRADRDLAVEIATEPGVSYVTRFIGTRRGYDAHTEEITPDGHDPHTTGTLPHRRYSEDVGAVLAEVAGANASYTLKGDEIYVRAKIISSKPKANGSVPGEFETAWTQPLVNVTL